MGLIAWVWLAHVASMLRYAMRYGRDREVPLAMLRSGLFSCAFGALSGLPWYIIVGMSFAMLSLHMGDSSALTAGMVLDARGGKASAAAWTLAYAGLGVPGVLAPLFLRLR